MPPPQIPSPVEVSGRLSGCDMTRLWGPVEALVDNVSETDKVNFIAASTSRGILPILAIKSSNQ